MKPIFSLLSKKTVLGISTAILALGFVAPAAKAATFDFGCSSLFCSNTQSSLNFMDDGIGVNVTGFVKGKPGKSRDVKQTVLGLGILGQNKGSSLQVDSGFKNKPETLRLSFDHVVEALTAEFRLASHKDSVKVIFDGVNTIFEGPISSTGGLFQGLPGIVNFTAGETGSILDFTVTDKNDSFSLYSLEVAKAAPVDVPEPTAVIGLLTVGAVVLATKKKRIQRSVLIQPAQQPLQ